MFALKLKVLAISFFLIGLASAAISYGFQETTNQSTENLEKKDAKVFYRITIQSSKDSAPVLFATKYRLQKADGSWKETMTNYAPDGSVLDSHDTYAINGKGVYAVSEKTKTLSFRAERPSEAFQFSETKYKESPNYTGISEVAGFRTLVQRVPYGTSDITEFYAAPDFNGLFLKCISKSNDAVTIEEATEVKVEPISEKEFGMLPDYPINYNSYQNKIKAVESVNNEQAEQMKKNLPNNQ